MRASFYGQPMTARDDDLHARCAAIVRLLACHSRETSVVLLIVGQRITGATVIGIGSPTQVSATPASVLSPALRDASAHIVLAHTHPSGAPPSREDHAVTRRLVAAAAIVGVRLRAHLVVTDAGHTDILVTGTQAREAAA